MLDGGVLAYIGQAALSPHCFRGTVQIRLIAFLHFDRNCILNSRRNRSCPLEKPKNAAAFNLRPAICRDGADQTSAKFAATFGNTALLIIDPFFYDDFSVRVPKLFEDAGMKAYCVKFPGYAGHKELDELIAFVKTLPEIPDTFIGMAAARPWTSTRAVAATYRKNCQLRHRPDHRCPPPSPTPSSTTPAPRMS